MTNDKEAAKKKATDEWFAIHKSTPGDYDDEAARLDMLLLLAFGSGFDAAIAHTEAQHAERVKALITQLQNCIDAIETLPQDVFGVGGDGETHWYVRDELIGRSKQALAEHRTEDANE